MVNIRRLNFHFKIFQSPLLQVELLFVKCFLVTEINIPAYLSIAVVASTALFSCGRHSTESENEILLTYQRKLWAKDFSLSNQDQHERSGCKRRGKIRKWMQVIILARFFCLFLFDFSSICDESTDWRLKSLHVFTHCLPCLICSC